MPQMAVTVDITCSTSTTTSNFTQHPPSFYSRSLRHKNASHARTNASHTLIPSIYIVFTSLHFPKNYIIGCYVDACTKNKIMVQELEGNSKNKIN